MDGIFWPYEILTRSWRMTTTLTSRAHKAATSRIIHDVSNPKPNFCSVYVWHCVNKHISSTTRVVCAKAPEQHEGCCCCLNQISRISEPLLSSSYLRHVQSCKPPSTTLISYQQKLGAGLYSIRTTRIDSSAEMQGWPSFSTRNLCDTP